MRFEASTLGLSAWVAPPIVLASFAGIGFLAGAPGRALTGALVCGLPIAAALVAGSMLAAEPSLELQLSVRGGWRPAALRRVGLLVASSGLFALVALAIGRLTHLFDAWPGDTGLAADLLMVLAPLSAFAVWGCLLGTALRSRGAAAAALTSFWLAGLAWKDLFLTTPATRAWYPFMFLFDPHAADAVASQLVLLALAGVGLVIVAAWLGRPEWLLGAEDRL